MNFIPNKLSKKSSGLIISVLGFFIGGIWVSIISQIGLLSIVDTMAAFFGPIFGVMIVDYYFIKKQTYNPKDLMPNIQYWLGEVHYAQKNFEKAIIEFGEGLKNYPESIKGPDNLLKLGLSFSNLKKMNEA